jgi:surfeit locus 1 family protein
LNTSKIRYFIPLLSTLIGVSLLLALGTWQVFRLQEKTALQVVLDQRLAEPVIDLPNEKIELSDWQYRRVRVRGKFIHDEALYLLASPVRFKGESGLYVLTPFVLDDGRKILVQRGFIPQSKAEISTRPETLDSKEVELEVVVHAPERKPRFGFGMGNFSKEFDRSDLQTRHRVGIYVDINTISALLNEKLEPYYLRVVAEKNAANISNELPEPGAEKISLYNPHKQYALTWYSLALILLIVYVIYIRKQKV